jgi:hypothetical protein
MNLFKMTVVGLGTFLVLNWLPGPVLGSQAADNPAVGRDPTDSPFSDTWQYARKDENGLMKIGNGSLEGGLNVLGEMGYELFIVTTSSDKGAAGYHYFRRSPWQRPMGNRPRLEYKRIDSASLEELGSGSFDDGLTKLEKEHWQLIAVTTVKGGGVGYHYFMRPKR